jgi:hypothetical protein
LIDDQRVATAHNGAVVPGPEVRAALYANFAHAVPESVFVGRIYRLLWDRGFDETNTLACVGVCRDELTHPLVAKISAAWGEAFNFSSLAGLPLLGRTGFAAAAAHGPLVNGRRRYLFINLAHIALSASSELGVCTRPGQLKPSRACGALWAIQDELEQGPLELTLDPTDLEQSLLKQRLSPMLRSESPLDIRRLTELTQRVSVENLRRLIALGLDTTTSDYALVSGIQIHGPSGVDFVTPAVMEVVANGQLEDLTAELQSAQLFRPGD